MTKESLDRLCVKVDQLFRLNVAAILFGILILAGAVVYHDLVVSEKASYQQLDQHYKYLYQLLTRHSALWDRYIQADELEQQVLQMQLDSIRQELNANFVPPREVYRSVTQPLGPDYRFEIMHKNIKQDGAS